MIIIDVLIAFSLITYQSANLLAVSYQHTACRLWLVKTNSTCFVGVVQPERVGRGGLGLRPGGGRGRGRAGPQAQVVRPPPLLQQARRRQAWPQAQGQEGTGTYTNSDPVVASLGEHKYIIESLKLFHWFSYPIVLKWRMYELSSKLQ